jgi:hypothetical protein
LKAVEEQASLFGLEDAGGDALQDLCGGGQKGTAVFDGGKLELRPLPAVASIGGEASVSLVVVAEWLTPERWAAATVAIEEDVAALVTFGWLVVRGFGRGCDLVRHGVSPLYLSPKVFEIKGQVLNFRQTRLNTKARCGTGLFLFA